MRKFLQKFYLEITLHIITQTDDADWKIDATNVAGENLSSLKVKKGSTVYVSVAPNGTVTINTTVITEDATHKEVK